MLLLLPLETQFEELLGKGSQCCFYWR